MTCQPLQNMLCCTFSRVGMQRTGSTNIITDTDQVQVPGLIVMQLISCTEDKTNNAVYDPNYSQIWVFFNSQPDTVDYHMPKG